MTEYQNFCYLIVFAGRRLGYVKAVLLLSLRILYAICDNPPTSNPQPLAAPPDIIDFSWLAASREGKKGWGEYGEME